MGRIAKWRAQEVMESVGLALQENANAAMDEVVRDAKLHCPTGLIRRAGRWSGMRQVSFTPSRGRSKGQTISFSARPVWQGREPGDLKETIRRVNRRGGGSVRVYAGTYKIDWAALVEKGSHNYRAHPFLRPAFFAMKTRIMRILKGQEAIKEPDFYPTRIGVDPKTGGIVYIG